MDVFFSVADEAVRSQIQLQGTVLTYNSVHSSNESENTPEI